MTEGTPPVRRSCQHCGRGKVNRPRGLCWVCYYAPGVRELYPSTSKYAPGRGRNGDVWHGRPDTEAPVPLPDVPTDAPPGSKEKIRILMERAAKRQALWHPDDNPYRAGAEPCERD